MEVPTGTVSLLEASIVQSSPSLARHAWGLGETLDPVFLIKR